MSQFFTLLTKTGQGLLANAIAYGEPLTIAEMAIGDGGGTLPTPDATVTRLVNEVRRGPINQTTTDPDNPNWIIAEQVLPPDIGGWTIREVGLYDTDGNLIAYGNYPETYKPRLSEGSARTQTIRFVMEVTDTSAVTLRIDPSVVMASRKYVDDQLDAHAKSRNHPAADTKNSGMMRFATLTESKKGEEAKAAQTPAGGKAQLDDHRNEATAHKAGQIALDAVLSLFGETVKTVQGALAALGSAATSNKGSRNGDVLGVSESIAMPDTRLIKLGGGVRYSSFEMVREVNGLEYSSFVGADPNGGAHIGVRHTGSDSVLRKLLLPVEGAASVDGNELYHAGNASASQDEVTAGSVDTRFVTPKKLRMGFVFQSGRDGFIGFPWWLGSFLIQWGYIRSSSINSVVWPTAFPREFFGVAAVGADSEGALGSYGFYNMTIKGASVSNTKAVQYIALGR